MSRPNLLFKVMFAALPMFSTQGSGFAVASRIGSCGLVKAGQVETLDYCPPSGQGAEAKLLRLAKAARVRCPDGRWVLGDDSTNIDYCAQAAPDFRPPPPDPSIEAARNLNVLGNEALNRGEIEKAIDFYTNALKTNATQAYRDNLNLAYARLHALKASEAFASKSWDLAISEYRNALVFRPGTKAYEDNIKMAAANKLWDAASEARRNKRFDEAVSLFQQSYATWPSDRLPGLIMSVRLQKENEAGYEALKARAFARAITAFQAALALDPANAYARQGLKSAKEGAAGEQAAADAIDRLRFPKRNGALDQLDGVNGANGRGNGNGQNNSNNGYDAPAVAGSGGGAKWKPPFLATPQENAAMRSAHAAYDDAEAGIAEAEAKLGASGNAMERIKLDRQIADLKRARQQALEDYQAALQNAGVRTK